MTRHIRQGPKDGARQEWRTPLELGNTLVARHRVALDAAAVAGNTLAPRYLGPDHLDPARTDATAVGWGEACGEARRVAWCNPPFSRAADFLRAALESLRGHRGAPLDVAIFLLPANLDTRWARVACAYGAHLGVFHGRLRFAPPLDAGDDVEHHRGAAFPMMLVGLERWRVLGAMPPTFCLLSTVDGLPITSSPPLFWSGPDHYHPAAYGPGQTDGL